MRIALKSLFIFLPVICLSQKQGNIWYFGNHAGVDFSGGNPFALTNGATYATNPCPDEGTSVISDSSGSLLFYTNGKKVWNKNHQVMPNGDSLMGNTSATQSSVIVPLPDSSRYFYIFTTNDFCNDQMQNGFRYTVVDMCKDGGLGDVITSQKNIKLLDSIAEKVTVIKHANGTDYWVITHKYFSDAFFAFQLSSGGIISTVISHVGSVHPSNMIGNGGAIGQLKASPDGKKLAIVNGNSNFSIAEYFDVDNGTGIISNCVSVQTNSIYNYYGVSFSQDNSKLYISCWLNNNGVYQFDLNAAGGDPDSVKASKKQIDNRTHYGLQLSNTGKIYLVRAGNANYLSVINNPNASGLNCNYQDSAVYLNGKTVSMGLPNFLDSYNYTNDIVNCNVGIPNWGHGNIEIFAYPNPTRSYTTIDYTLPDGESTGEIFFYDPNGNEVKRFKVDRTFTKLQISTADLAPGTYYYQLKTANQATAGKKMVVIK